MNILGNLLGNIGGTIVPAQKTFQATQLPYKIHLGVTDGDTAYNTMAEVLAIIGALSAGSVWTKIWQKTVPAQQQFRWGFGSPSQQRNQGYMWFCSLDSGTDFEVGVLRLVQAKSRETVSQTVAELDDTSLHGTTVTTLSTATPTSINDKVALPEKIDFPRVGEDSLLQLYYRCITPATAEDNVGFSIPATVYQ